eukprot:scaffold10985_cov71-Cylindrotheca_fusiformis.AAC.1
MEHANSSAIDPEDVFVYTSETKYEDIPKETLTHLRVDSSVTEIPDITFCKCMELKHVQISETLTSIGEGAFFHCNTLESVEIVLETSNNSIWEDGPVVFTEREKLQIDDGGKVMFCSVSTKLGESVFQYCRGLVHVSLPEGLQVIEKWLFSDCESLTMVKIPSSVVTIGDGAFNGCSSLPFVDLPNGLLELGEMCFEFCASLETLQIPASVSTIGQEAFSYCTGLAYITLPPTLETIEARMFECCRFEYIDIPSTVSFIGVRAFYQCCFLSHIRIPPSVEKIAPNAFLGCKNLISVELPEGILIGIDDDDEDEDPDDERFFVLVNLAMPKLPEDDEVVSGLLFNDSRLGSVVDDEADLVHRLKHRFVNSPLN